MMLAFLLVATNVSANQQAVLAYKDCLRTIVAANEKQPAATYLPLEKLVAKVERECAIQRTTARDALAKDVAATAANVDGRRPPEGDSWKEELIRDATLRWMNSVIAEGVTK